MVRLLTRLPLIAALLATGCFVTLEPHERGDASAAPDAGSDGCLTLRPCTLGGQEGRCVEGACCLGCVQLGGPMVYSCGGGRDDSCDTGGLYCEDCARTGRRCLPGGCG